MNNRVGFHLPSWMIGGSLALVVIATLVYFYTESSDKEDEATPSTTSAAADPDAGAAEDEESDKTPADDNGDDGDSAKDDADKNDKLDAQSDKDEKSKKEKKPEEPKLEPSGNVAVFNNSGITNLAAEVGARVEDAGWSVTGTDNWYGSIPENTVYYPPNLQDQAELLAEELGIGRIMASVEPMQMDRLSVILTAAI